MLILPGGTLWDQGGNAEAVNKAKEFLDAGLHVAAICGATAGLAHAGILDTRKHTSNAREYIAASGYRGGALFQDGPVVMDKNLITASAMAPLEFAREIFVALDLYSTEVLDAWYNLFSTRKPEYFGALMAASGG
jgi:putative intracellular protease/amidase